MSDSDKTTTMVRSNNMRNERKIKKTGSLRKTRSKLRKDKRSKYGNQQGNKTVIRH